MKKKKKRWTNSDFAKYFFFCFTHTELLTGFLKVIVRLAGRYVLKLCFSFETGLSYIKKRKHQEDEITIIHILKFVGLAKAGNKALSCYYLAFC